jgi:signal transduction histidine kinase
MAKSEFRWRGEALREKQRIILVCAPVTMLFAFADALALRHFSWVVFGVRSLWAALIVVTALLLTRLQGSAAQRWLLIGLAVASSAFFALLAWMTGGFASPLFHWILAMPLVIAVVLQDYPVATVAAAITTLASGIVIVLASGQPVAIAVEWAIEAAGMSALAVYASTTYRRLRAREQALREAGLLAEERARSHQATVQARDQFLSIASHELKTPLTALVLQVEGLLRRSSPDLTARQLAVIERQADRLTELVDTLLDLSRISLGRLDVQPAEADYVAVVRQVVQRYASMAERHGCPLSLEAGAELPGVFDAARIEQVLSNLLGNALKFGRGKPITISVTTDGEHVRITVRDEGIGIPLIDQRRIFDRFERAASDRHYGGLGLGLWISRQIVEQMGGQISVRSEPGRGAAFTVALPLRAAASTATA